MFNVGNSPTTISISRWLLEQNLTCIFHIFIYAYNTKTAVVLLVAGDPTCHRRTCLSGPLSANVNDLSRAAECTTCGWRSTNSFTVLHAITLCTETQHRGACHQTLPFQTYIHRLTNKLEINYGHVYIANYNIVLNIFQISFWFI